MASILLCPFRYTSFAIRLRRAKQRSRFSGRTVPRQTIGKRVHLRIPVPDSKMIERYLQPVERKSAIKASRAYFSVGWGSGLQATVDFAEYGSSRIERNCAFRDAIQFQLVFGDGFSVCEEQTEHRHG